MEKNLRLSGKELLINLEEIQPSEEQIGDGVNIGPFGKTRLLNGEVKF